MKRKTRIWKQKKSCLFVLLLFIHENSIKLHKNIFIRNWISLLKAACPTRAAWRSSWAIEHNARTQSWPNIYQPNRMPMLIWCRLTAQICCPPLSPHCLHPNLVGSRQSESAHSPPATPHIFQNQLCRSSICVFDRCVMRRLATSSNTELCLNLWWTDNVWLKFLSKGYCPNLMRDALTFEF